MELRDHPFFHAVDGEQVSALEKATTIIDYPSDAVIFEEGTPSDALFLLLEGEVAFCKRVAGDSSRAISYARPGDYFGEIGLFTGQPRSLQAESRGKVRLAVVARDALLQFITNTPGPIDHILQSIINHLHATTRHYVTDMLRQEKMSVVGTMINTIIHDFKNPFCLISLAAQLIRSTHKDERTQKLCQNIEDQIQRMNAMAEEINEFSRGQQRLRLSKVSLPHLADRFRELNLPFFEKPNINIRFQLPDVSIDAEENKLIRVFQNLIGNAIEALEEKGGLIIISGEILPDDYLLLRVADNGGGIPEQIRANFFEPFVTFGKKKGTGLGTAIVKSIVEGHGGKITFETAEGEGTTFLIRLPLNQSSAVASVA